MDSVDFVVVGGGVYGTTAAYHLSKAGASTHLLEGRSIAARASGGPGRRGVRANGRDSRELPLMRVAYNMWPELHRELDSVQFYERTGQLLVVEREEDVARAKAQCFIQSCNGIDSEWLDGPSLRALEPEVSGKCIGAIYCRNDGVADHTATTRAFAAAAAGAGARISEGVAVRALEIIEGRANAVRTTSGERIPVKRGVLLLTNSEVASLLSEWVHLPVWNEVFQVLISEPLRRVPFTRLTGHMSRTVSLKCEPGDRVMISGGWRGVWDADAQEGSTLAQSVEGNVREAVELFPALEGLRVERADASHQESLSLDGIPIIDALPEAANVLYATGWCGHGWAIAPVVAQQLAQWALTGHRPPPLSPFSLGRFGP